tara:strand:- start:21 stop:227 length:207 start_codon:yes stop_codon:yes gene_type:complete
MEASAIIAIISVSFTGIVGMTHAVFTNMSMSRCSRIDCCCISCVREVLKGDDLESAMNHADVVEPRNV